MVRRLVLALMLALSASGDTIKLYLKDGNYHLAREYQVLRDRVRYYSTERGAWEEIPLALVDLERTKKEVVEREREGRASAKSQDEEEKAERAARAEISRIPVEPGVYLSEGSQIKPLKQADSKVVNNKKRSVLKVISPIPVVAGKATVELDGDASTFRVTDSRPQFYMRLSAEERFGIIKLGLKKDVRVVEKVSIIPVSKEIFEEPEPVESFRQQLGDMLYKIWPTKPLEPGEYAVVEYSEGKLNIQVWDFGIGPAPRPAK